MTENIITVASRGGIYKANLRFDLIVNEYWLVDEGLQFVLFLLAKDFNQSLVLENDFKWNLVVTLSLR